MYTQCPHKDISREAIEIVELAEHAIAGAWPVAGGVLDQSSGFVDCVGIVRTERTVHKLEQIASLLI